MVTVPARILVVDDERGMREVLSTILGRAGHSVVTAADGQEALQLVGSDIFDLVITDLKMPGRLGGMEILKAVKDIAPDTVLLVLTAYATLEVGIEAVKLGAYDVLTKPFNNEHVVLTVRKALDAKRLTVENLLLKRELKGKASFENLVGTSEVMQKVFALIRRVAETSSTVLICGESGTGKELVARAIHYNSPRRDRPFVTVNCGALPEPLLESELFGHERGAFTGAIKDKRGLFTEADHGTLFLDEISETTLTMQVKLLRAIQERVIRKVGGNEEVTIDVRIIAATNKDLHELV